MWELSEDTLGGDYDFEEEFEDYDWADIFDDDYDNVAAEDDFMLKMILGF